MRVALYGRVSTDDRGQDPENQLAELRRWAGAVGHEIVGEYVDHVSGAKGAAERSQLDRLLHDAHRRRFDIVACWSLDRLSREGLEATIGYLRRLDQAGVLFHSYNEPMLSTTDPMVRSVLLAVLAAWAKMERARISERTRAGLARVRAKGVRLGAKPLDDHVQARIAELAAEGATAYAIAKHLGIDAKSAAKYMRAAA